MTSEEKIKKIMSKLEFNFGDNGFCEGRIIYDLIEYDLGDLVEISKKEAKETSDDQKGI